ncbi:hypothetical protein ACGF5F_20610 [Streptomyces sp. NPDC047821]|uniref:hypothetical protein n=1 Tax=Streptomyces sp. NPDC047821 TaxID=3365488 RepID=UPI00372322A1
MRNSTTRQSGTRNTGTRNSALRNSGKRNRPGPFPPHLLPARPPVPPPPSPYDERWWVPPLVATALGLVLLVVCSAPLREAGVPPVWLAGYLAPLAILARSWFADRRHSGRGRRVAMGAAACLLILLYERLLTAVTWTVAIVMVLTGHVRA